jgi:hypothetical protein
VRLDVDMSDSDDSRENNNKDVEETSNSNIVVDDDFVSSAENAFGKAVLKSQSVQYQAGAAAGARVTKAPVPHEITWPTHVLHIL